MNAFAPERANPRDLPISLVGICGALIAIGVAAFAYGLARDPDTAWRAYHVNFIYFATLAQGGLCLACAIVIIDAKWPGPVRHVAEGLAAWVPISLVLLAIGYLGRESIHTNWIHGAPMGKEGWLTIPRVYITDFAILFVLSALSVRFLMLSVRPALRGAAESSPRARGLFARWSANWRGDEIELAESARKLRVLAPIIALLYAFGYTIVGYDQVMSLTPTWFSTMFGWYFGWSGFLSGIAMTTLICVLLRNAPGWEGQLSKERFHDLGKMLFAFSIFWMYLFFSQYIVIWYGNLPEETQFFELRLGSQFLQDTWYFAFERLREPYVATSLVAWAGCWIVPFWVLLGQAPKRSWYIVGPVAAIMLIGFWLERNVLVWPSLVAQDGLAWLGPIQLGIAAGFFGAFALVYLTYSRIFPTLPVPRQ
ncbi:MAG TPA: hypothetical protein VEC18_09845 [Myxococcota bacterium]|nr:hypothetical protein [Myxococcota bacterium]